jgi:protocatechuate 3,4-dioxygenase beta subunit
MANTRTARALIVAVTLGWMTWLASAQTVDPEFARMWEAAQRERPATLGPRARVGDATEPGDRLLVRMQVLQADAATPAADAIVFIYQTDRDGHYDRPGRNGWRLKSWARTDAQGRVEFTTIRPGAYPGRRVAAHVHVGIEGPPGRRHVLPELLFEDDELVTPAERSKSDRAGRFANVRPVRAIDGGAVVEILYRLPGDFVF